jgi:hypothetical protein
MRCVCGYDDTTDLVRDIDKNSNSVIMPNPYGKFIPLRINAVNYYGSFERTDKKYPDNHVGVFACPVCGTLKVDI